MQIAFLLLKPGRLRNVLGALAVASAVAAFAAAAVVNDHPVLDDETSARSVDLATAAAAHRHAPLAEAASVTIGDTPDAMPSAADERQATAAQ